MYDLARLKTMRPTERRSLWQNASKIADTDPSAQAIVDLIESSGLSYLAVKEVALDSEIGRAIERIVFSVEGRAAALDATERGRPALEGLDPLLSDGLGKVYRKQNGATVQAGYVVTNLMRQLGYEPVRAKSLKDGCVASTGQSFRRTHSAPGAVVREARSD